MRAVKRSLWLLVLSYLCSAAVVLEPCAAAQGRTIVLGFYAKYRPDYLNAAAEACLRLFPELMPEEAQVRLHWQDVGKPISQADPYLGHVFPANQLGRIERSDGNFAFTYTTDEHGFRNRSPWPERADIVVLGDSMAFGYGVEDDQAWPTLLEENLPDSRVINLGLIGAAPQQYFRIYKTFGQALQPSLVLFCLFPGNDVTDAGFSTSG
jgi:hypothetical protein